MDRLSFITGKHIDNTGTIEVLECGAEDCRCKEPGFTNEIIQPKKLLRLHLLLIATTFFMSAAFYSASKIYANASAEMIRVSRKTAISCSPSRENRLGTFIDYHSINNSYPAEKDNGGGCPHQHGANAICQPTNSKRRLITIHTCSYS